jgi:hypothetical protein
MKDDKDFDKWYKTKITENAQDPPEEAWQNIADELDVNDVWHRISVELDSPRGWSPSKAIYYSIPVLLLFLFSGVAYYYFNRTPDLMPTSTDLAAKEVGEVNEEKPAAARTLVPGTTEILVPRKAETLVPATTAEDDSEEKTAKAETFVAGDDNQEKPATAGTLGSSKAETLVPATTQALLAEDDKEEKPVTARTFVPGKTEPLVPATTETLTAEDNNQEKPATAGILVPGKAETLVPATTETLAAEDDNEENPATAGTLIPRRTETLVRRAGIPAVIMPDSMLNIYPVTVTLHPDSIEWISVADAPQKLMHDKTIEFGLTASVKNTWLLNRLTLLGLERHTLNTTVPDFGKDIGMVFAYNFSRAFSAQAEGMFISESGQRYKEYRNGKYVDREADLRYYTLNLLLKYNRNKASKALLLNGHSIVGGLYASRLNKATETINGQITQSNAYEDYNYGVILGYEYNRFVSPNLLITSGLRVNYGFPNIDKRLFLKTFTGSFDLNIGVKYRFNAR